MNKNSVQSGRLIGLVFILYFILLAAVAFSYIIYILNYTDTSDLWFPTPIILILSIYYSVFVIWSIRIFTLNKPFKEVWSDVVVIGIFGVGSSLYYLFDIVYS